MCNGKVAVRWNSTRFAEGMKKASHTRPATPVPRSNGYVLYSESRPDRKRIIGDDLAGGTCVALFTQRKAVPDYNGVIASQKFEF